MQLLDIALLLICTVVTVFIGGPGWGCEAGLVAAMMNVAVPSAILFVLFAGSAFSLVFAIGVMPVGSEIGVFLVHCTILALLQ